MPVRPIVPADRETLVRLLRRTENFTEGEQDVAIELLDDAIRRPESGYEAIVATPDEAPENGPLGYLCYGRTPMTERTWDLYWVVVDPDARGRGLGRALMGAFEDHVAQTGGGLIRVETSSREGYGKTARFYDQAGYPRSSVIADFYKPGDDLITFIRRIEPAPTRA